MSCDFVFRYFFYTLYVVANPMIGMSIVLLWL